MEPDFDGNGGGKKRSHSTAAESTKYFPPGPARKKVITRQYLNRFAEKRARQSTQDEQFAAFDPVHVVVTGNRVAAQLRDPFRVDDRDHRYSHRRRVWQHELTEGRDLARSHVPLPYSGQGPIRRPTLEREEAFRDPTTCKRVRTSIADSMVSVVDDDVDPETAQLYQMGLLYDDEYSRGSGFTLNTIVHDEPAYTLRLAKRPRKGRAGILAARAAARDRSFSQNGLSLNLSFAQLHNDEMIAKYLISPSPSEINPADWETSLSTTSEAVASVHSFQTEYFPYNTQDTQMSDAVPDLISDECFWDDPQTTQTPEFDCDSDTTSLSGSDADLVILPLHMSLEEDERTRQSATPRRSSLTAHDDATASWIMLGDDS